MTIATKAPEADFGTSFKREVPELRTVIVGDLAQHGYWVIANISTNSFWPITSQQVRWRGADIWILPITIDHYPAVTMRVPEGKSQAECEELIMRFLSMLSWIEEQGFMVEGIGGGNLPRPMGRDKQRGFSICHEFDLSYFPEVTDEKAMLALALMREGRGLNHVGYAFLSFYRVLEVAFSTNTQRIAWISAALTDLTGHGVKEALNRIVAQGVADVGLHLFQSGRCAMAHANRKPIIDPDKPADARRLGSELPIVRALAVKAIEEVFGVETLGTNFRKHLYELAGFKAILGPTIVVHAQNGTAPAEETTVNIPDISVRIRGKEPYAPLEGLRCTRVGPAGKLIQMQFESLQGDIAFRFKLDFGAERLGFDPFSDIRFGDAGSAESAERVREACRFWQDHFGNGQLHIFNTDTGELIARKDAYLPVNMYFDSDGAAAELAYWEELAAHRRKRDEKYAAEIERYARGYDVRLSWR